MKKNIKGSILVVEDQQNWQKALLSLLGEEGYSVSIATNFQDAKEEILNKEYDLLILDVRLIDEDIYNIQGIELLHLAKSLKAAPKVIILTGYHESIRKGTLEKYPPDALLLKVPDGSRFDTKDFKEQVQELLLDKN